MLAIQSPAPPGLLLAAPASLPAEFGGLIAAAESCAARDQGALDDLMRQAAAIRPGGRSQGLEWAGDQYRLDIEGMQHIAALLRALQPHEAAIRALLASPPQSEA